MDDPELIVPLAGIFFVFGLPPLVWLFFRMMAHRERMAMIQRGPYIPPGMVQGGPANWQVPPVTSVPNVDAYTLDNAQCTLRKGIRLSFIGFALTTGLSFIGFHDGTSGMYWHPGPWLLGGLVPLFIGLAQIMIALMSGATLGAFTPPAAPAYDSTQPGRSTGYPPPPQQPQQPGANVPPPTYDSSYTYRPGTTPGLPIPPMPPAPPDRR